MPKTQKKASNSRFLKKSMEFDGEKRPIHGGGKC